MYIYMSLDKTFFLDIFNQIFKVNDVEIMMIFDIKGKVWFKFKDVLRVLGYKNLKDVIFNNNLSEKYKKKFENLKVYRLNSTPLNFQKNTLFINESGLYKILLSSNKKEATNFIEKITLEIMPQIREKGEYILDNFNKKKLDKLNNKIDNYKQELTYYYDKYNFETSSNGYFYINEDKVIKNGKNITCYKIGYCKDMEKRMQIYKVGNFNYKPLAYLTLNFTNGKEIEDCVKDKYKPHILKLKSDILLKKSLDFFNN